MAKVIRMNKSAARLGIARSTLYDWQNPLSPRFDASLPQRVKLGRSAAGLIEEELDAWIDRKKATEKLG
jgi:prophage regulatory protein